MNIKLPDSLSNDDISYNIDFARAQKDYAEILIKINKFIGMSEDNQDTYVNSLIGNICFLSKNLRNNHPLVKVCSELEKLRQKKGKKENTIYGNVYNYFNYFNYFITSNTIIFSEENDVIYNGNNNTSIRGTPPVTGLGNY
jgi:hypothetical protein